MKRLGLVAIALLVLLSFSGMIVNSATVGTWLTYREDITCTSGNADIDTTFWLNGTSNASGAQALNITLPCAISALSQTDTNITWYNTDAPGAKYNLTVNGVAINTTGTLAKQTEAFTILSTMVSAGVTNTAKYINVSLDCNQTTTIIGVNITGTNCAFHTDWLNATITIKEKDITSLPSVGLSSTTSIHTVNNSFNISNTTIKFPLTGVVWNVTYPTHKISSPDTTFSVATLATNGSRQNYTQYQKYGPYVYDVDEDIDGTTHEVTVRIKAREVLTNCVQWVLDPDDDVYDDAFDTINDDTLDIEYNSVGFSEDDWSWDDDDEELTLEDFTCRDGFSNNKFVFTWTEAAPYVPPEEETMWDWFFNEYLGIPIWAFVVIGVIIILALGYIYMPKPKKKKKKR